MLLQQVLSAISAFYLLVFKIPVGVGKWLESWMKRSLSKGSDMGESREMALVS